jgi:hypothetical protein
MTAPVPDPLYAILHRLAACIRMLLSTNVAERDAAINGVQRTLKTVGEDKTVDVHALASRIEQPSSGLSDTDKKKIQDAIKQARKDGYAEGFQAAQNKQHGADHFLSTDAPEWAKVALYVQREKHRLPAQHHQFADDMAARTVWEREPTERQHKYLHSLFLKLGGRIT